MHLHQFDPPQLHVMHVPCVVFLKEPCDVCMDQSSSFGHQSGHADLVARPICQVLPTSKLDRLLLCLLQVVSIE